MIDEWKLRVLDQIDALSEQRKISSSERMIMRLMILLVATGEFLPDLADFLRAQHAKIVRRVALKNEGEQNERE